MPKDIEVSIKEIPNILRKYNELLEAIHYTRDNLKKIKEEFNYTSWKQYFKSFLDDLVNIIE